MPKLETQIEFSVGIFSHERVKHLNFTLTLPICLLSDGGVPSVSCVITARRAAH